MYSAEAKREKKILRLYFGALDAIAAGDLETSIEKMSQAKALCSYTRRWEKDGKVYEETSELGLF